jgi:sugar phosphate permease
MMVIYFLINWADRANIGMCLPSIKKEFHLSNVQAGALASFYFIGYAFSQVPAGMFMGRIGARVMTSASMLIFSGITFLIGTAPGAAAMKWYRLGLGAFEGPAGIGAGALLKTWFPPREQATATGTFLASANVATMLVAPVCAAIIIHWGWRTVFYAFSVPGIIMAVIWYVFVRNWPEQSRFCNDGEQSYIRGSESGTALRQDRQESSMGWVDTLIRVRRGSRALDTNSQVFRTWSIWANALAYFFTSMVFNGMITWVPMYLLTERGFSMAGMGWLAALQPFGSIVGAIGGGWASDRLFRGRRKPMIFISLFAAVIIMYLLAHAPANTTLLAILLFLAGPSVGTASGLYISFPMGFTTRKTYPTGLSMVTTASAFGGFLSPLIVGYLLDAFKLFNVVFLFFGMTAAAAFICVSSTVEPLNWKGTERE